jgi:hypothetical protein
VRAELSRLRRVLGSIIESRPYRLEASVSLDLTLGDVDRLADCAFVRTSTSPGIRALAGAGTGSALG